MDSRITGKNDKKNDEKVKIILYIGGIDSVSYTHLDCGFLSSIVADDLKFYPLMDDPLCAVMPKGHPLTEKERITLPELFAYPLIIETPGCDNDIQHLLAKCPVKPKITYSFWDDTLIMAFVKSGLGVTISQEMVLKAFARDDVESVSYTHLDVYKRQERSCACSSNYPFIYSIFIHQPGKKSLSCSRCV